LRLAKAHGLGNDFLLLDGAEAGRADGGALARRLCERHRGIGADGLIVYTASGGAATMRLHNADGGEAEISGNGLRCLSAYLVSEKRVAARHVVTTAVGPRDVEVEPFGGSRYRVTTDLGEPILASRDIPVVLDPPADRVIDHRLEAAGRTITVTSTSMGNPHCAIFGDAPPDDATVTTVGPALENHAFFPRRTNVEFITVVSRGEIRVRFWERGVGYTTASGTGAASAAVASMIKGLVDRRVRVVCDGGVLEVEWPEGRTLRQTGEVEVLFQADWRA
jgi:diaminopimelate epimerase